MRQTCHAMLSDDMSDMSLPVGPHKAEAEVVMNGCRAK